MTDDLYGVTTGAAVNVEPTLFAPDLRTGAIAPIHRESVTSCMPVITTDHAFIHEGIAYTLSGTITVSGTAALSITTPSDGYVHFKPAGVTAGGGPVTVTLIEGASITGGTTETPRNRRRLGAAPDASAVTCKVGVTPSGGTTIATLYITSSTTGTQKLGSSASAAEEFVLRPDTTYVLRFDESATGDVVVGYDLFWYEEGGA